MAWTLQSLIDGGMTVTTPHCQRPSCNHNQPLDLVRLKDLLGPDTPMADDLKPRLKCVAARQSGLIYSPVENSNRPPGNPISRRRAREIESMQRSASARQKWPASSSCAHAKKGPALFRGRPVLRIPRIVHFRIRRLRLGCDDRSITMADTRTSGA